MATDFPVSPVDRVALKLVLNGGQDAVIQDGAESGDGGSALSTGKVDPQAPGRTKRLRVGNQLPNKQSAMGFCDCRPSREWRCNLSSCYGQNGSTSPSWTRRSELGNTTQTENPAQVPR